MALEKRSANCLKLLHDTAKAISSGVSYEKYQEILPRIGENKEIYNYLQNVIAGTIIEATNEGFEEMKIAEKMDNLAEHFPWEPTGDVNVSAQQAYYLKYRKIALEKKLETLDKENEVLMQRITDKRETLKQIKEALG